MGPAPARSDEAGVVIRVVARALQVLGIVAMSMAAPAMALAACPVVPRGQALPRDATPERLYWQPWRDGVDELEARLRQVDASRVRLVFIGDSITQFWDQQIFQSFYASRSALNLGVGGDATMGTLWRLGGGNWPTGLHPETIVLLIGTNNLSLGSRPEDVAIGVSELVTKLQQLAPIARILLLGVLPRGASPADPMRASVTRVNQLIASCADGRRVFFSDPGPALLDGAGQLSAAISPDGIHLSPLGYERLSSRLEASLRPVLR